MQQFKSLVDQLIASEYLDRADCLVFSVMSHGRLKKNRLEAQFADGKFIDVERDIIEKFSNQNCPALLHKPKIFIFPFCRFVFANYNNEQPIVLYKRLMSMSLYPFSGEKRDRGIIRSFRIETDGHREVQQKKTPIFSDIMICYGSCPEFVTFRNTEYGSYYVTVMCQIWAMNSHEKDLNKLLQLLTNEMMNNEHIEGVQVCSHENRGFHKDLFFNPGLYLKEKANIVDGMDPQPLVS